MDAKQTGRVWIEVSFEDLYHPIGEKYVVFSLRENNSSVIFGSSQQSANTTFSASYSYSLTDHSGL